MRIALYRGTGLVSKLIKWQSRGKESHAATVLEDTLVIESKEFIGVRIRCTPSPVDGGSMDLYEVATTPEQDAKIRAFLMQQVEKRYDYWSVLRFISRTPVPHWDKRRWFCSELVFEAFSYAGIELLRATKAWEVSPAMLARSPLLKQIPAICRDAATENPNV